MVNTTHCDVCNHHEYKCYKKNTFKQTNTSSIFSDKYLHLNEKQNIVMSVLRMSKKRVIKNTFNHKNM